MSTLKNFPIAVVGVLLLIGDLSQVFAESTPTKPVISTQIGEITGNDVYVRSGPSRNYYPVCKLNAGQRVRIVAKKQDWLEILPAPQTFSLISKQYVDTIDNRLGTVNGNNVRVRAGSNIPEWAKERYCIQTQLDRGAAVKIVGQLDENFLKIEPPAGVVQYIHIDFVQIVPDALIDLERQTSKPADTSTTNPRPEQIPQSPTEGVGATDTESADQTVKTNDVSSLESVEVKTPARERLIALDEQAKSEIKKPLLERDFVPLILEYKKVNKSAGDEFDKLYAQTRIQQIEYMERILESVRKINKITKDAEEARRAHLSERARMRTVEPSVPGGFDAQGELRISAAFAVESGPKRFRLIDPSSEKARTIAYVEITPGSSVRGEDFVGRYIGVRASEKRLLTGGVNPIPIYVAAELVSLEREKSDE